MYTHVFLVSWSFSVALVSGTLISRDANIKEVGLMNLLQSKNHFSSTFAIFVDTQSGFVNKYCQVHISGSGSFTRRLEDFQKP